MALEVGLIVGISDVKSGRSVLKTYRPSFSGQRGSRDGRRGCSLAVIMATRDQSEEYYKNAVLKIWLDQSLNRIEQGFNACLWAVFQMQCNKIPGINSTRRVLFRIYRLSNWSRTLKVSFNTISNPICSSCVRWKLCCVQKPPWQKADSGSVLYEWLPLLLNRPQGQHKYHF